MIIAETFIAELEGKNQSYLAALVARYLEGAAKENFTVVDLLKFQVKTCIEATEVAAIWVVDTEHLGLKMTFARQCGDGAKQFDAIRTRMVELRVDFEAFDPRATGYSKMFAFFRSLQTTEERACAGAMIMGTMNRLRMEAVATLCDEKSDPATAQLFRDVLMPDEQIHVNAGRQALQGSATAEESQARARRSSFKTIELLGELQDPATLKKFLVRSAKK